MDNLESLRRQKKKKILSPASTASSNLLKTRKNKKKEAKGKTITKKSPKIGNASKKFFFSNLIYLHVGIQDPKKPS